MAGQQDLLGAELDLTALPPLLGERERSRYEAMIAGDMVALCGLLAPDLLYAHSTGSVDTKQTYLRTLESGVLAYKAIRCRIARAMLLDDNCCVASGDFAADVIVNGAPRSVSTGFVAGWRKTSGDASWQLAFWHSDGCARQF